MLTKSSFKKGHKGYWLGKKMPKWIVEKMSESRSGIKNWKFKGEKLFRISVDNYHSMHRWIERNLGKPKICSNCKTKTAKQYDWANISHKYKKVLSDWIRLCAKCHMHYDLGKIKLKI